ncbi:HNH endonuclease [Candidatus Pacearchaeota archaeon]|jgi:hypothetical protein|nr:HNH endonuclease [Candidatus Pacearchaeota archaeon]
MSDPPKLQPIPSCRGYFATRNGQVWSAPSRPGRPGRPWPGGFLKTKTDKDGYLHVTICTPEGHKDRFVHHLILETFTGSRPKDQECRHLDGNPANNTIENLCWGTRKENYEDSVQHGTNRLIVVCSQRGEAHGKAVLTEEDVKDIRSSPLSCNQLAIQFGVSRSCIQHARQGRNWRHIND